MVGTFVETVKYAAAKTSNFIIHVTPVRRGINTYFTFSHIIQYRGSIVDVRI